MPNVLLLNTAPVHLRDGGLEKWVLRFLPGYSPQIFIISCISTQLNYCHPVKISFGMMWDAGQAW